MRIRQVSTNCSFSISFEEFEDKFLDSYNIFFDDEFDSFGMYSLTGAFIERYDLFFESSDERLEFIKFVEESEDL